MFWAESSSWAAFSLKPGSGDHGSSDRPRSCPQPFQPKPEQHAVLPSPAKNGPS